MNSKQYSEYHLSLDVILRKYNLADFHITRIHCNGEFKPMMEEVQDKLDDALKYASKDKHVPEAKRNNCTIKEQALAIYHCLPFKKLLNVGTRDRKASSPAPNAKLALLGSKRRSSLVPCESLVKHLQSTPTVPPQDRDKIKTRPTRTQEDKRQEVQNSAAIAKEIALTTS